MNSLQKNNNIDSFVALFQKGYDAWIDAGKIVSSAIEEDPDFAEKVHAKHPEISCDTVYAFDRLGRKELHPKLLISDSPGAKKLRRMPYSIQEKYSNNPVPLLIKTEKGWETLPASAFNLTPEQANQAFDSDGVRPEAAQRAWLECKTSRALIQVDDAWRVAGRKLIVMQPCQFTAKQLARIFADMES
jgi:hypothetical protein